MRVFNGLGSLRRPEGGVAVTIGTFDGVHVGHRALIARARSVASARGAVSAALTWDRHPVETLRPGSAPPLLTTTARKLELLEGCGIDLAVVLAFTRELSRWPPERFVEDILVPLGTVHVVVGRDWRFGHKAAGDVRLLGELGRRHGFEVEGLDLVVEGGRRVSSSLIRELVAAGDVQRAAQLLARPFDLDGEVMRGDGRGRALGYPTANIDLPRAMAHPRVGVYAGFAAAPGLWRPAAIDVGVNPTFGGDTATTPVRVEAYLLDFDGDLYGRRLRIGFLHRLRDELRFASVDDLLERMAADVAETRRLVPGPEAAARWGAGSILPGTDP